MGRALLRDEVPVGQCKVRALFSYSGESPQDLGFVEGDIIEVLNNGDGDWWTGKLKRNKLVGIFPRNFVEYVNTDQETMSAARSSANPHPKKKMEQFVLETFDIDSDPLGGLGISEPLTASTSSNKSSSSHSHTHRITKPVKHHHHRDSSTTSSDSNAKKLVPLNEVSPQVVPSSSPVLSPNLSSSESSHRSNKVPALNASVASNRSAKSTIEILDDVGAELNGGLLDDVNLDAKPEELRSPELKSDEFDDASFGEALSKSLGTSKSIGRNITQSLGASIDTKPFDAEATADAEATSGTEATSGATEPPADGPPIPPPHTTSLASSRNSHYSANLENSRGNRSRSTSMVPGTPVIDEEEAEAKPAPKSSALTGPVLSKGTSPGLGIGNGVYKNNDILKPAASPPRHSNNHLKVPSSESKGTLPVPETPTPELEGPTSLSPVRRSSLSGSPALDQEVPFDRALKQESKIPDHIGSHFDSSAYGSQLGHTHDNSVITHPNAGPGAFSNSNTLSGSAGGEPVIVNKTRAKPAAPAGPTNVYTTTSNDSDKKPNFLQRLFPKNTQRLLGRSVSRSSQKSNKSARSVKAKLMNVKSLFSFSPNFEPDDNLYPTNNYANGSSNLTASTRNTEPIPGINGLGISQGAASTNSKQPDLASSTGTTHYNAAPLKPIATPERNSNVTSTYDTTARIKANALNSSAGSNKAAAGGNGPNSLLSAVSAGPLNTKEAIGSKWIETRRDLYRAQTLTERDLKKRRQDLELQGINCDNLVMNLNQLASEDFHDYRLESFENVDQAVLNMSTWPQLMTPSVFASSRIGRHFRDPIERVRAVFLLCATRISHVDKTPQPNNVMHSRTATPAELAATICDMCTAVDIECKAIDGHIRRILPNSKTITSVPHSWNAVKVNDEWRLLDAVTAAGSSSAATNDLEDDGFVNLFYFLTPPSQLIFSHVPNRQKDQFFEHPLPTASAALLPLAAPEAFAQNVLFDDFWLGLTRVSDLEIVELTLSAPDATKDVVALVDGQSQFALSQAIWDLDDNTRHFRVKALVPQHQKQAMLQLYVVPKSQADRSPSAMDLVWSVELRHVDGGKNNAPFEFIGRYATPATTAGAYDMYVKEPQCRHLGGGDLYTFKIDSFDASHSHANKQPQMSIQSPSGRLTRLVPVGTDVTDEFKTSVKTLEVGTWRAVVRRNDQESWVPFAEWFCS